MKAKVQIPKCWKQLIGMNFPADCAGMTSEKQSTGNADPNPHYDDYRCVSSTAFADEHVAVVSLMSGQSNYYGWLTLVDNTGNHVYEAELESYDDLEMEAFSRAVEYTLEVEWV